MRPKVCTCFILRGKAEEAAKFYVSLIPNSRIDGALRPDGDDGAALLVEFTLGDAHYQIINDGPAVTLDEAASISVRTVDQAETDRLWAALIADGGAEVQCGWLKDRFGVSWQIVPEALMRMVSSPDRAAAERATQAMYKMKKIDIAGIERAFAGA